MPLDEYHFISTRLKNKQTKKNKHTNTEKKIGEISGVNKV